MVRETLMWFQDKGSSEKQSFWTEYIFSRLILEMKETWNKLHSGKVKDCFLFHCYFIYILCEHIGLWEVCVCVCVFLRLK